MNNSALPPIATSVIKPSPSASFGGRSSGPDTADGFARMLDQASPSRSPGPADGGSVPSSGSNQGTEASRDSERAESAAEGGRSAGADSAATPADNGGKSSASTGGGTPAADGTADGNQGADRDTATKAVARHKQRPPAGVDSGLLPDTTGFMQSLADAAALTSDTKATALGLNAETGDGTCSGNSADSSQATKAGIDAALLASGITAPVLAPPTAATAFDASALMGAWAARPAADATATAGTDAANAGQGQDTAVDGLRSGLARWPRSAGSLTGAGTAAGGAGNVKSAAMPVDGLVDSLDSAALAAANDASKGAATRAAKGTANEAASATSDGKQAGSSMQGAGPGRGMGAAGGDVEATRPGASGLSADAAKPGTAGTLPAAPGSTLKGAQAAQAAAGASAAVQAAAGGAPALSDSAGALAQRTGAAAGETAAGRTITRLSAAGTSHAAASDSAADAQKAAASASAAGSSTAAASAGSTGGNGAGGGGDERAGQHAQRFDSHGLLAAQAAAGAGAGTGGGAGGGTGAADLSATLALARANGESVARNSGDSRNSGSTGEGSGNSINAASGSAGPTPGALSWVAPTGAPFTAGNSGVEGRIAASPGTPEFAPQLAAHVSTFVRDGLQTARLELNPAEMGPLTVQIQLDGNAARVHLAAENAQTRQALEQAMPQLAGNLRESGLTLSGGGVFEQPRQPQQQAQQGAGGNADERGSRDSRNAALGTTAGSSAAPGSMAAPGARRTAGMVDLVA